MADGPVIARNVDSGEQVLFPNRQSAASDAGIMANALKVTYVDKPRQLKGIHYRTAGHKLWKPSPLLQFDRTVVETAAANYITAADANGNVQEVYESRNAAAKLLGLSSGQVVQLGAAIRERSSFRGRVWREADEPDTCGTWHDDDMDDHSQLPRGWATARPIGESGRCAGFVIAYSLADDVDIEYTSFSKAALANGLHPTTVQNRLGRPRQAKGLVFRKFGDSRRWSPMEQFWHDPAVVEKLSAVYIISEGAAGDVVNMYEGAPSAARDHGDGFDYKEVTKCLGKGTMYKGLTWRKALPSEYETYVDV